MIASTQDALGSPAFALTLTCLVWAGAIQLTRISRSVFNPVLTSVIAIIAVLLLLDIDYASYRDGVSVLITLLGPAIVALALPLYRNRRLIASNLSGILTATVGGSLVGVFATFAVATGLGLDATLVHAVTPKHATSAVSAALATATGAAASLAAVLSVVTGVIGAVFAVPVLRLVRVRDPLVTGLTLGVTAHAIGTARAFDEDATTGSMAAVGMAIAAIVVPLIVSTALIAGVL
jgi:putative effector of murein hydrolase